MTTNVASAPQPAARTPLSVRVLAIPAVVGILVAGLWFWSGIVARSYWMSIGAGVAWFSRRAGSPLPAGVDLQRYGLVVFWCVPFNQALAKAQLSRA